MRLVPVLAVLLALGCMTSDTSTDVAPEPLCPETYGDPVCPDGAASFWVGVCPLEDGGWQIRCDRGMRPESLGVLPMCREPEATVPTCGDGAIPICVEVPTDCVGYWPP